MFIKESHSLLFTKINDIIILDELKQKSIKQTKLFEKINTLYEDIVIHRMNDNKMMGDSENFADKYKVIEKDIYYGYSITAHKSQGSTYNSVIVDEPDFQKIHNGWNYRYNKLESRIKEKNQLRYVAYTRAKTNLYIVYDDTQEDDTQHNNL